MRKSWFSVHYLVAIIVFITGLLNILTALSLHHIPHIKLFEGIIPSYFMHVARTFTLISGFLLVNISINLVRRKRRALALSALLIFLSILLHFVRGFNPLEIAFLILLLIILLITRPAFEIESDRIKLPNTLIRILLVFLLLFIYSFFGFYLFQNDFSNPVNLHNIIADYTYSITGIGKEVLIPATRNALWFANSISLISIIAFIWGILSLFQPLVEINKVSAEDKEKIKQLILAQGHNSVSYFALMNDMQYFYSHDQEFVLAYKIKNNYAIVLGDPVCKEEEILISSTKKFVLENQQKDIKTIFYNTLEESRQRYSSIGYKSLKIGEEALLPTSEFTLSGSSMADIRHEVNKINREKGTFTWFTMDEIPWRFVNEINLLHTGWINLKKSPQLTFSLNFYPFPIEKNAYVQIISGPNGDVWSVLSFFPYKNNQAMILDFMIRTPNAPHGVIEAGIADAASYFKNRNIQLLSLGLAPLADITIQTKKEIKDTVKNLIFERFNQFYQYKSLYLFKKKFNPKWQHKYLLYKNDLDLPSIMVALAQVHLKQPFNLISLLN